MKKLLCIVVGLMFASVCLSSAQPVRIDTVAVRVDTLTAKWLDTANVAVHDTTEHRLPGIAERMQILGILLLVAAGFFVMVHGLKREADKERQAS